MEDGGLSTWLFASMLHLVGRSDMANDDTAAECEERRCAPGDAPIGMEVPRTRGIMGGGTMNEGTHPPALFLQGSGPPAAGLPSAFVLIATVT